MFFISFWMPKTYALQMAVNVAVLSLFIQPISFFMLFLIIFFKIGPCPGICLVFLSCNEMHDHYSNLTESALVYETCQQMELSSGNGNEIIW